MRRPKQQKYSYIVIIAAIILLAAIIYLQKRPEDTTQSSSTVNPATTKINIDTTTPQNNRTTQNYSEITHSLSSNKNLSTQMHPADNSVQHPNNTPTDTVHIVPSLTIGSPSINSAQSETNNILREKYLAAIRSGEWPDPQKPKQPAPSPISPAIQTGSSAQVIHIVKSGESLSSISKKYYNDPNKWRTIYNANRKTIGSKPNLLRKGQKLVIPSQ